MSAALIVIIATLAIGVARYTNRSAAETKINAIEEALIFSGLVAAMGAIAGLIAATNTGQLWNGWLVTSLVVVGICTMLYYTVGRFSLHRA